MDSFLQELPKNVPTISKVIIKGEKRIVIY
jgi:hypothetical protein